MSARPAPKPVLLTLKQRRAQSICEFFSPRRNREVIVHSSTYWVALWLEWSPAVRHYVERPQDPENPAKGLADFWIASADEDSLLEVTPGRSARPRIVKPADPWQLESDGLVRAENGVLQIVDAWQWSRRTLLLSIERVHPFSVAAHARGGLKSSCRRVVSRLRTSGQSLGQLQERVGGDQYLAMCAIFSMVHRGDVFMDWDEPITLKTRVWGGEGAP